MQSGIRGNGNLRSAGDRSSAILPAETGISGCDLPDAVPNAPIRPIRFTHRRSPLTVRTLISKGWLPLLELAVIALFAIWIAKPYLDFNEHMMPGGIEYWSNIFASTFWDRMETCGTCALWNGSMRGGFPAMADTQSALLHPVVAIPALALGWVNGAKVTIAAALFLAGFSQWWLARVLGLGLVARLWSGCVAAAAGSMTGRMEDGGVLLLVCGAACAMVIPPFIQLARDGRLRTAAILGITIGLALLSGQAYLQFAGALIAPFAMFALVHRNPLGRSLLIRRYALAGVIGVLIASPLIVPYLHVMPSYTKYFDQDFVLAQPFAYIPLNFVIDDREFYRVDILGKMPFAYVYLIYVGWLAVLLAFAGVMVLWFRRAYGLTVALMLALVVPLWLASAQPLRWMAEGAQRFQWNSINELVVGFRSTPLFSGLAVTPLLGFAAVGLDWLWRTLRDDALSPAMGGRRLSPMARSLGCILLLVLLAVTTNRVRAFSENWIYMVPDGAVEMGPVLDSLETEDLQWIETPYGEQTWWGPALQRGLKLSMNPTAWFWNPSTLPPAVKVAATSPPEGPFVPQGTFGDVTVYAAAPGNEYAAIVHSDGTRTVCSAHGIGGDIDIACPASSAGQLVVLEHMTDGWKATVDGERGTFAKDTLWIGVDMTSGATHIQLRYRPWDVPVGVALMIAGLIVAAGAFWLDRRVRIRRPQ